MLFRDLLVCNKDWDETTDLIVVSNDSFDAIPIRGRAARSLFGDRQVLWFRDCVVMLL
uniref:Uncharacterized protein n=1 Tax=Dulem virus 192 TaxID=3145669 RepID=A0AAU8B887_9VIRU